ncbi:MAG: phosphate ABC transporter permease family protein, partial [Pseudomonadota bacterium]|nr:phosphate ABC transporter permease family protein [Pseudomonadota bacterium]
MQPANLMLLVIAFVVVAYGLGYARSRSLAMPMGGIRHLKSLPFYYGARAALWCGIPALIVLALWAAFQGKVIQLLVIGSLPPDLVPEGAGQASLLLSKISNVASGALPPGFVEAPIAEAAERLQALRAQSRLYMSVLVVAVAVLAGFLGWIRISPKLNARSQVETTLKWIFFACAALAILTPV